jgi:aldose 1-epimerase
MVRDNTLRLRDAAGMSEIEISDGQARAVVLPDIGAGLARYDYIGRGEPIPLMRPAQKFESPIDLASFPLVPWSGRISGSGFMAGGQFQALPRTFPGFDLPIHGNGWAEKWTPRKVARDSVMLELDSSGPGPFNYLARFTHRLEAGALVMELAITNRAAARLPYGAGFHPYYPRTPGTRLMAPASGVWINDENLLPLRCDPIERHPDWNFREKKPLPPSIDTCFAGWPRITQIDWPDRGIRLKVEASERMGHYVLYSPAPDCGFFCFEPVSHACNAHNLPDGPEAHGLVFLEKGETLEVSSRLTPLL